MRFVTALALAALPLGALPLVNQAFDTRMPDSVPAVTGKVMEGATLRYIEVQTGAGAVAAAGQQYTVQYTGWLRDGTKFDSSVGKEPIQFVQEGVAFPFRSCGTGGRHTRVRQSTGQPSNVGIRLQPVCRRGEFFPA